MNRINGAQAGFVAWLFGQLTSRLFLARPACPALFLASDLFDAQGFRIVCLIQLRFDPIAKQTPRKESIQTLRAILLAFHRDACGWVNQYNAGGNLVNVLPAVTTRVDEALFQVGFPHT